MVLGMSLDLIEKLHEKSKFVHFGITRKIPRPQPDKQAQAISPNRGGLCVEITIKSLNIPSIPPPSRGKGLWCSGQTAHRFGLRDQGSSAFMSGP
jgi:hypothetical protein